MPRTGKTKKTLTKRFKTTSNNKMMHRTCGQNHFLAKKSGDQKRAKKMQKDFLFFPKTLKRTIK
jgi:ribosomal protein L35